MPFRSKRQLRFMFARHPQIAKRWVKEQKRSKGKASFKRLPERAKSRKR